MWVIIYMVLGGKIIKKRENHHEKEHLKYIQGACSHRHKHTRVCAHTHTTIVGIKML